MNFTHRLSGALLVTALGLSASRGFAQAAPYKILNTAQTPGTGRIDYVSASSDDRRLYVPRGSEVLVFDLDTLKSTGTIPNASARGVAVDPKSHHAFCSSKPVVMWDTKTLATLKTIDVQGNPDGILFEPLTERIYVLSHSAPNVTVIDGKDGTVVGTIDLEGQPEQGASDGQGHVYIDLEDKDNIAVVDAKRPQADRALSAGRQGRPGPGGPGPGHQESTYCSPCATPRKPA